MIMSTRNQLMYAAAVTAFIALSGPSKADDYSLPVIGIDFRSEERAPQPLTCAEATQAAWFRHQMELSDGGFDNTVPAPAECQRDVVAKSDAYEAIHAAVGESE
jgi:hypothetical protein